MNDHTMEILRKLAFVLMGLAVLVAVTDVSARSRIKDIVVVEGVRDNQLIGYGLVVGLNGTGDTLQNSPFTRQSIEAMLERLGVNTRAANMRTDNVAAVMVTADLTPFARQGTRMDVTVSAIGDAEDLRGGTLLVTPLMGADGEVYAVAQGSIAISGFSASGDAGSVTQGIPTSGRIPNGAIIERELDFELAQLSSVKLSLNNPDFTTARRISNAINDFLGAQAAMPLDPATVVFHRPAGTAVPFVELLTSIEQIEVQPDQRARVIIDEKSGTIVIGSDVRVDTVAIAQGSLTIRITETPVASQPAPFAEGGQTEVLPRTNIEIDDGSDKRMAVLDSGVSLQELVDGLNALGVGPRDMISILQAIKAAGALHADLEVL